MCPVVIAPTRVRNVACRTMSPRSKVSRHRPYEGSQPDLQEGGDLGDAVSSSPLRGFATGEPGTRQAEEVVVIAPTRVRNAPWSTRPRWAATGRHRPYEGSQPEVQAADADGVGVVVIAPTRVRNRTTSTTRRRCRGVVIAPTRVRNMWPW